MGERLGTMSLTVEVDDRGNVAVHHGTDLSTALDNMQHAMTDDEKRRAIAFRKVVCQAAAEFFLYVRNPDAPTLVAGKAN